MFELSPTRCNCIAILWVILVSFAIITLYVASEQVFIVASVYFVIDSVRQLLDTPSYMYWKLSDTDLTVTTWQSVSSPSIELNAGERETARFSNIIFISMHWNLRRGSSVSIVTRPRAGQPGFDSLLWQEFFLLCHRVQTGPGAHPASYPGGTRGSLSAGKAVGSWSWLLTPSIAKVKNT
jgi:hypothetical protein